jgi:hypothetical protein
MADLLKRLSTMLLALVLMAAPATMITGCETEDDPIEEAGDEMEEAADEMD